jgi:hypothetical protein
MLMWDTAVETLQRYACDNSSCPLASCENAVDGFTIDAGAAYMGRGWRIRASHGKV